MLEKLCRDCFTSFPQYNTAKTRCDKCSYNRYHKQPKPIKRMGKKAKAWADERTQWIIDNPPDEYGYWYCYLMATPLCPKRLDADQLTIDHTNNRNHKGILLPCCVYCNGWKGSRSLDVIAKILPHVKKYLTVDN